LLKTFLLRPTKQLSFAAKSPNVMSVWVKKRWDARPLNHRAWLLAIVVALLGAVAAVTFLAAERASMSTSRVTTWRALLFGMVRTVLLIVGSFVAFECGLTPDGLNGTPRPVIRETRSSP
jgi:hypothetical protein